MWSEILYYDSLTCLTKCMHIDKLKYFKYEHKTIFLQVLINEYS